MKPTQLVYPVPLALREQPEFRIRRKLFTRDQCKELLELGESRGRFYQEGGPDDSNHLKYRKLLPGEAEWAFQKMGRAAVEENVWGFALTGFESPMRILKYEAGGFTEAHSDFDYGSGEPAKLTGIMPLVPKRAWTGGFLTIGNHASVPRLDVGDCVFFPSHMMHWVTPVERGVRVVLGAWISGPSFI